MILHLSFLARQDLETFKVAVFDLETSKIAFSRSFIYDLATFKITSSKLLSLTLQPFRLPPQGRVSDLAT